MKRFCIILACILIGGIPNKAQQKTAVPESEKTLNTQWRGKRVAYLGDSITDSTAVRGTKLYWEFLQDLMGIKPLVYGVNGHQWSHIYGQAEKLLNEQGDNIDAIMIFAGTNDYNGGIPIGKLFDEEQTEVTVSGPKSVKRLHRTPIMADSTFCGRINKVLHFLKEHYPTKQIILLTPVHRGYARFGDNNIQPDEYYCNGIGLFLETYVNAIKLAAEYWSVPVIDLYATSGLLPNMESHSQFVSNAERDRLHPNSSGHYRMAKTLQYSLIGLPATFSPTRAESICDATGTTDTYGLSLLDEARTKVLAYNKSKKLLNFAFITDTHAVGIQLYPLSAARNVELFKTFCNEGIVDFAVHGGDVYTGYFATNSDAISLFDEVGRVLGNVKCPLYYVKGNHDRNGKCRPAADMDNLDWKNRTYYVGFKKSSRNDGRYNTFGVRAISESEWDSVKSGNDGSYYTEKLFVSEEASSEECITDSQYFLLTSNHLKDVTFNPSDRYGGYFYKDYEDGRIRVIVANVFDSDIRETPAVSREQADWLAGAMATDKALLIFAHAANPDLLALVEQAKDKGSQIVAYIHGHSHRDSWDTSRGFNVIGVTNGYGLASDIAENAINAYSFSVFSIDMESRILYETRVGHGNIPHEKGDDRRFEF